MTIRAQFSARGSISLCAAALFLSACGKQQEVRRADNAYQQALVLNDLGGQRRALMALVKADEDVSDNWIRLARVELELGAYSYAYEHFSRAHEIDRTAVYPLSMMTELAVINGRLDFAEDLLKELLVIAPDDRAVAIARGFGALREGNYEKAQANASLLLAQGPRDSIANVLQTRILVAQKKILEAVDLLNRQLQLSPNDRAMLRSLGAIHRYMGSWSKASAIDLRLWRLAPDDASLAQQVVADALRADDRSLASKVTQRVLTSAKARDQADGVLSAWSDFGAGAGSLGSGPTLPASAPDQMKIAFAHYLNRVGHPDQALAVLGRQVRSLDGRENVPFNAVFAESLFLKGQAGPARHILDRVLSEEPDDAIALSARARLLSRIGDHRRATIDAQRLVASYATIADYRVLLAAVYRANKDSRGAERALWDGYRDLPANETLYKEVRQVLMSHGNREDLSRLESGFNEEKFAQLMKELA